MSIYIFLLQHRTNISQPASLHPQLPSGHSCHHWPHLCLGSSGERCLNFTLYWVRRRRYSRDNAYDQCNWREMDKIISAKDPRHRHIQVGGYAAVEIKEDRGERGADFVAKKEADVVGARGEDSRGEGAIPSSEEAENIMIDEVFIWHFSNIG